MAGIIPGIIPGTPLAAAACAALGAAGTASAVGITAPLAEPGIGIANGFHIFCMNAIASCAVNGAAALSAGLPDSSVMFAPPVAAREASRTVR
jgi:hypothetical protein